MLRRVRFGKGIGLLTYIVEIQLKAKMSPNPENLSTGKVEKEKAFIIE